MLRNILITVLVTFTLAIASSAASAVDDECVILLHGLGRTSASMSIMKYRLEEAGYTIWNEGYPSRQKPIEELVMVIDDGVAFCRDQQASRIHFVTHSLGGILVRKYFQDRSVEEAQRVVMIAPPNQGSEVTDQYRDEWWYQFATGPAGQQLGTDEDSVPLSLSPIDLEIGIIAGTNSSDPWFNKVFAGDHDGKVSVSSTKLAEMRDFLLVDSGHTFIMNSDKVIEQIKAFLRDGKFMPVEVAKPNM
jgi:alpha-beta hydrolase superfamily lysophospholipase